MSKLQELRERRIVQIIVAYAAGGWILLEVFGQLIERGLLPEFIYPILFAWYILGLLAAGIVGWYHGEKGAQKATPLEIGLLSILLLVALGFAGTRVTQYRAEQAAFAAAAESSMDLRRIAVLYFDDLSPGDTLQHLADGLTEDLILELESVRELNVVSRNGVAPFRASNLPPDSVARVLGTGTLVEGSVQAEGGDVRVNIQLVDGESGAEIQRAAFERTGEDVLALRDELSQQVSRLLRSWLGEEIEVREREAGTDDPRAWILVQRAERALEQMVEAYQHDDPGAGNQAYQTADDLLGQAEVRDPEWAEPPTIRSFLAYRRSRLSSTLPEIQRWIETGMEHAGRALAIDPTYARALEARGTLRYWNWILDVTPDPEERTALLEDARSDLEAAVRYDRTLASAHSTLSHLYSQSDAPSAIIAARDAYEEDAYLDVANEILWRLFTLSWDMRQLNQARNWCAEGSERFPEDHRFIACQLRLMTQNRVEADPERAWSLVARLDSVASGPSGAWERIAGRMSVGAVLHRSGLPDSAHAVVSRARAEADHEVDPLQELAAWEAYIRTVMGDEDEAVRLLRQYVAANPGHAFDEGDDLGWIWDPLRDHPGFRELSGGSPAP